MSFSTSYCPATEQFIDPGKAQKDCFLNGPLVAEFMKWLKALKLCISI